jgi:chromosome segregation ATPase
VDWVDLGAVGALVVIASGLMRLIERLIDSRPNARATTEEPAVGTSGLLARPRETVDLLRDINENLNRVGANLNDQHDAVAHMRPKIDALYSWHDIEDDQGRKVWRCMAAELLKPLEEMIAELKGRPCITIQKGPP